MNHIIQATLGVLKDRRGASALEFALISPVMIMMLFGVLETGRILHNKSSLQRGVEIAARYAMVNQTATASELKQVAFDDYSPTGDGGAKPSIATSTVTVGGIDFMVISATLDHTMSIPLMNSKKINLAAESRVPLE